MGPFDYFGVALDSIGQNKVRSLLTMLGVIIGVMSVILLISLGEGAQAYIEREFAGMGSNVLMVTPGKQETSGMMPIIAGSFRRLTYENAKEIMRRGRGVRAVAPVVVGAGAVEYGDRRRNTMVVGSTEAYEKVRDLHAQVGRFLSEQDVDKNNKVCVIGTKIQKELFGTENPLNKSISINRAKHTIVGVLEPKGVMLGMNIDDLVFIPLRSGQLMFYGGDDRLFQIVIGAKSPDDVKVAMESVREILKQAHDYVEDFTIIDQTSILATFNQIFVAMRVMLAGIAGISLLVGGIGIMNIMLVSVRERTREVGVRKAVGATRHDIGMQFVIESIALSSIGGSMGIALGFLGTFIIRTIYPPLPVYTSTWSVLLAFGFSMAVGVFFGAYPAIKASGVDPVEALRYE
ncbi:MAG: FtsX-like permease family protein [Candidatus Hydrogenedentes bacterium]|nr:FtsX-like permease family protein [Candidatus Hydrogenedentota bacterium]